MVMAQIASVAIFLLMFILLATDRIPRHHAALGCGLLTMLVVFGLCLKDPGSAWYILNLESIFSPGFWYRTADAQASVGINWETILFLSCMMIMVDGMALSGFFRWLCISIAHAVRFKPLPIFLLFILLSAGLSMFIDSITVIMFLAAVTIELALLLQLNPVPMLLAEIFCANLGGSATMCGDPPNIIIGTALHYSFFDFISNTGLIALFSLLLTIPYFYLMFRGAFSPPEDTEGVSFPSPSQAIVNRGTFLCSCVIFSLAVVLLVTHEQTGLTISSIGVVLAFFTLLTHRNHASQLLKNLDYKTLLFFIGLFLTVGSLEHTGILRILATGIQTLSGGQSHIMVFMILWGSGVASAFIDNIPFAATMIPVIRTLAESQGIDLQTLAWALSIGTDIGGSATPIGASANVVGISIAAKSGYSISWKRYCKVQVPVTLLVLSLSTLIIFLRYL